MEKLLASENLRDLMVPSLIILTNLFQQRGDLIEQSDLLDPDLIREINLGRMLGAGHYKAYTDFLMTTNGEQFAQARTKMEQYDT